MDTPLLLQPATALPLDEKVWEAWLEKNRQAEALYFAKRMRITLMLSPLLIAALLFWLLKTS